MVLAAIQGLHQMIRLIGLLRNSTITGPALHPDDLSIDDLSRVWTELAPALGLRPLPKESALGVDFGGARCAFARRGRAR